MQCLFCQKETNNPKYCNRQCSNAHLRRGNAKSLKKIFCESCNTEIPRFSWRDRRKRFCEACNIHNKDWTKITYREVVGKRLYQKHSRIRELARQIFRKSNIKKCCSICGYDKHYEIHHIKSIGEFDLDTPISIINDLSNLVALCPNHHWEADNSNFH